MKPKGVRVEIKEDDEDEDGDDGEGVAAASSSLASAHLALREYEAALGLLDEGLGLEGKFPTDDGVSTTPAELKNGQVSVLAGAWFHGSFVHPESFFVFF